MSTATTPDIAAIVRQVIAEIAAGGAVRPSAPAPTAAHPRGSSAGAHGVFACRLSCTTYNGPTL
jgi:hypothetical protein